MFYVLVFMGCKKIILDLVNILTQRDAAERCNTVTDWGSGVFDLSEIESLQAAFAVGFI